ncbi:hypothetical protein NW768_005606 [Fusarium equiseti]|uniref:Uncharacterized protein n=1 Tax=Fusarium equiseti TaxID=61235 RepID=A0ABQ8RCC7_FUSEQ|nr:hypothetical protein NW768_005606 [Fusarium equiseti]
MSYSSQRCDLDAAAARKRSQSRPRDRDYWYHRQSYNNRLRDDYYRVPEVSRMPSHAKSESCFSMKKEGRSRPQRQIHPKEQERSCTDYTRGDRSSGDRRIPSERESGRQNGRYERTSERSRSRSEIPAKRESHYQHERERRHPEEGRSRRRTSLRKDDRADLEGRVQSRRGNASPPASSHHDGEASQSTTEEINTFLNSGRASRPSWGSSTYGTYVCPLESNGQHRIMDPTKCTCKCCPHPIGIAHSHDHSRNHYRNQDPGISSKRAAASSKRTPEGRYLIQVIDKSRSALNRENGPTYPISLNPGASCDRIASFLAPEKRYAKVIVHWDDGRVQTLDNHIAMEDLIRHAEFLEVKEIKSVHWAA